jgi:CubicO group peptidase (beta-lactamase class C family)
LRGDGWFRPVSARPLAALRLGLSLLLLLHLIWISDDLLSLHGSHGIVPWELTGLLRPSWVPGLPTLAKAFAPLGIGEHTAINLLLSGYAASLLSLALGVQTRLSAFAAWALHLGIVTSGFTSYYGVDQLANTFLFYLVVFPSGRTSQTVPVACLRVMQIHLCVIYLAAGVDKALGSQWWNGEAIWRTLSQPSFSTFDAGWLASHSWIAMLAGWGTLIVEIGYAVFVWPRRTRKAWCIATIGLHLGTCVFMGLVFFSSVMIVLTICLFWIPEAVPEPSLAPRRRVRQAVPVAATCLLPILLAATVGRHESAAAAVGATQTELSADFEGMVRRLMTRDQIPGVAVGVVERGHVVYARGFGYRDVAHRLPVTPDTLFPLGSCSKAFTATAIALLVDQGRLALDAPVRTYLPDFALADPQAAAAVTTRDLLTHRSGLPRHDLFWYDAPFSRDELYRRLRFLEPAGRAHAQWRYDSLMYVVAGRIVEKLSGERWESFVQSRILAPLEMHRTVLSPEAMKADANHAAAYALRDGRVQAIPMLEHLSAIAPAGAVASSVKDLARWLAFHAMRSPALLRERTWHELHRPQAEMPQPAESEVQDAEYALGWIHETYRGHPLVMHNGAIDGYTVHLGFLPETGQGLVVLVNRDLASTAVMTLAYSAYDRLLGLAPLDWERKLEDAPEPEPQARDVALDVPIATLVGIYEHPAYGLLTVRTAGHDLVVDFRNLHLTFAYQGERRFLSREPIADGGPHISIRFSEPAHGEPMTLSAALNFEEGDPQQVFSRVRR